jgi:hypothetical protein
MTKLVDARANSLLKCGIIKIVEAKRIANSGTYRARLRKAFISTYQHTNKGNIHLAILDSYTFYLDAFFQIEKMIHVNKILCDNF